MRAQTPNRTDPWTALYHRGVAAYGNSIQANPESFRTAVERFVAALVDSQSSLKRLGGAEVEVAAAQARWRLLRSGLNGEPSFEGPPLLVVAGIGLGVAAIAWAVAAYQYAAGLREHTVLLERELEARVQASKEGRHLQPSTLSESPRWPLFAMGAAMLGVVAWAWHGAP